MSVLYNHSVPLRCYVQRLFETSTVAKVLLDLELIEWWWRATETTSRSNVHELARLGAAAIPQFTMQYFDLHDDGTRPAIELIGVSASDAPSADTNTREWFGDRCRQFARAGTGIQCIVIQPGDQRDDFTYVSDSGEAVLTAAGLLQRPDVVRPYPELRGMRLERLRLF